MNKEPIIRPEWVPDNAGSEFTTHIMKGVEGGHDGLESVHSAITSHKAVHRPTAMTIEDYVHGVKEQNRTVLARAITLIESNSNKHRETAQEVLRQLLPYTGNSIRIGISGVPGAGKSTFIESFGMHLIQEGYNVAVLAIDPSSSITLGSILGDKTRMEKLSRENKCFIRPSPSGGALGGVTRKTRESILLCEAAGFDVILIETVGVGQNEITVRSMVDFYMLVLIAGAGDELQGIKKGVIEIADVIVVNKADGDNVIAAETAKAEYNMALHYLSSATPNWKTQAYTCSAIFNKGISELWELIQQFEKTIKSNGYFHERRQNQLLQWVDSMLLEQIMSLFYSQPSIIEAIPTIRQQVVKGNLPPTSAVQQLLQLYTNSIHKD